MLTVLDVWGMMPFPKMIMCWYVSGTLLVELFGYIGRLGGDDSLPDVFCWSNSGTLDVWGDDTLPGVFRGRRTVSDINWCGRYNETRGMEHYFCGGECEVVFKHNHLWLNQRRNEHVYLLKSRVFEKVYLF